jgi:hypothetical protein
MNLSSGSYRRQEKRHRCLSRKEGDWFVFYCPECQYERRMNSKTREHQVKKGDPDALHEGLHFPIGINFSTINPN